MSGTSEVTLTGPVVKVGAISALSDGTPSARVSIDAGTSEPVEVRFLGAQAKRTVSLLPGMCIKAVGFLSVAVVNNELAILGDCFEVLTDEGAG